MHHPSWRRRAVSAGVASALLCSGLVVATAAPAAAATTIHVPADQPSIAAAMAVAVDGDTIEVAPGTYAENVDFTGKDVALVAVDGPATTTIDGTGGPVVHIGPGGSVQGFTITGGTRADGQVGVNGVRVHGTGALILRNRLIGNDSSASGPDGGSVIGAFDVSATIDGNLFAANSCGSSPTRDDGVIRLAGDSPARITNNVLLDNDCNGIIVMTESMSGAVLILNNTIVGSRTGLWLATTTGLAARNNVIADNAVGVGYDFTSASSSVRNNLISGNGAPSEFGPDVTGTNGNIGGTPLFIDRAGGDLRLQGSSPGIDAGTNDGAPTVDLDGSTRPLDGPDADADAEWDIGAFEWDGTEPPPVLQTGALDGALVRRRDRRRADEVRGRAGRDRERTACGRRLQGR